MGGRRTSTWPAPAPTLSARCEYYRSSTVHSAQYTVHFTNQPFPSFLTKVTMEDVGQEEDLELQQITGTIYNNNECEVGICLVQMCRSPLPH